MRKYAGSQLSKNTISREVGCGRCCRSGSRARSAAALVANSPKNALDKRSTWSGLRPIAAQDRKYWSASSPRPDIARRQANRRAANGEPPDRSKAVRYSFSAPSRWSSLLSVLPRASLAIQWVSASFCHFSSSVGAPRSVVMFLSESRQFCGCESISSPS